MFNILIKMGGKSVTLETKEVSPLNNEGEMSYERGECVFYDGDQKEFECDRLVALCVDLYTV